MDNRGILGSSYWLLGDDCLKYAQKKALASTLAASLVQSVIFDGALVVSDSYILNNWNLRRLIGQNKRIQSFVRDGYFVVANRLRKGKRTGLVQLRKEFVDTGKRPWHYPKKEYSEDDALLFLEANASRAITTYSHKDIQNNYTFGVRHAFQSSAASEKLGKRLQKTIVRLLDERQIAKGMLEYSFLYYWRQPDTSEMAIGYLLDKFLGKGTWKANGAMICRLASGPYITGLPDTLGLNPIYSKTHSLAVDLWRQRKLAGATNICDPIRCKARTGLSTYVQALRRMDSEDVAKLHDSDEWREYQLSLRGLNPSKESAMRLAHSYVDYRQRVEVALARKVKARLLKNGRNVVIKSQVGSMLGETTEFAFESIVDDLAYNVPVLGAGILVKKLFQRLRRTDEASKAFQQGERMARKQALEEQVEIEMAKSVLKGSARVNFSKRLQTSNTQKTMDTLSA